MRLTLWVSNMDVVGADADYTQSYLDAARVTDDMMPAHPTVRLDGQVLIGDDPDAVWAAYKAIQTAIASIGHGGDADDDRTIPAPVLTAILIDEDGAARELQVAYAPKCATWEDFCVECMLPPGTIDLT
jgi:hypothetical protein